MTNNYQAFLRKLRNVDNLETPSALTCQASTEWIQTLLEHLTDKEWIVDIDMDTGVVYISTPKGRRERGRISATDWNDLCCFIGIGAIPYNSHRYKLFADEIREVLTKLVTRVGKNKSKELLGFGETEDPRFIW